MLADDPTKEDSHPAYFPLPFLLRVYGESIETFERRCRAERCAPRHDDHEVEW
jgi:hypothetical protein